MILVECYGDEALIRYLGLGKADHNSGVGNIANRLSKSSNRIALIDADIGKTKPKYFLSLKQIQESNYSVSIFYDQENNNTVVSIDPDLEGFLLKVVKDTGSGDLLKKHKFPEMKKDLHEFFMHERNANKLQMLLSDIELHKTSPRLDALRNALNRS